MIDIVSRSPKLPKKGMKYLFTTQNKKSCHGGLRDSPLALAAMVTVTNWRRLDFFLRLRDQYLLVEGVISASKHINLFPLRLFFVVLSALML